MQDWYEMPEAKIAVPAIGLTPKGRIRGVLASLEQHWDSLTAEQQANALGLLSELSAAMRRQEVRRLKVG
jgi:hypothetical protein